MIQQTKVSLTASDVAGQRILSVRGISLDTTIGEVLDALIPKMNLHRTGLDGQKLVVEACLARDGRRLDRSEPVAVALRHEDHLVLHPWIKAGRPASPCHGY